MATQIWKNAYTELAERITTNLPNVKWVDLWHNQVGFLEEEHPFPTPALFLGFRSLAIEDLGELVQQVDFQLDVYYFYETFLDTYQTAYNQTDALAYLDTLSDVYTLLHGFSGVNCANLRRTAFRAVDTGSAGNLYLQTFEGILHDEVAKRKFDPAHKDTGLEIKKGTPIEVPGNDFIIP